MLRRTKHRFLQIWDNDEFNSYIGGFTIMREKSGATLQFTMNSSTETDAVSELKTLMKEVVSVLEDCLEDRNSVVLTQIEV